MRDVNNYKKVFSNTKIRKIILMILSIIPTRMMLKLQYKIKTNRKLDLKSPKRFTEKIQLYKLIYRNDLLKTCVDKNNVREYVMSKGLSNILVTKYGVFDKYSQINLDNLPDCFIIKSTNGGGNLSVHKIENKKNYDLNKIKKITKGWTLKTSKRLGGREFAYHNIKGRIIIEELLYDKKEGLKDYKFLCFEGKPKVLIVDIDRNTNHKRNFYDLEFNHLKVNSDVEYSDKKIEKPKNLEKMIEIAKILSNDFPFVRVDLYNIEGKIYFGELTFYPWSGYVNFSPDELDFRLGEYFPSNFK